MTRLRLLPAVPARSVAEERANRAALMSVAVDVWRAMLWEPRLRTVLLPSVRRAKQRRGR